MSNTVTITDTIPWIALGVSMVSLIIAWAGWWLNREKLRLDLYNRRFDVYLKTLDFWHALSEWKPTDKEKGTTSLEDSPLLRASQISFIKAHREAQFLFEKHSGIQKLLEQMHADTIGVIGYRRDLAPKISEMPELIRTSYNDNLVRLKRIDASIPTLEEKLAPYLNFHTLSAWHRPNKRK